MIGGIMKNGKMMMVNGDFLSKWTIFQPLSKWAFYDYWTCKTCKSQREKNFSKFVWGCNQLILYFMNLGFSLKYEILLLILTYFHV